MGSEMCIRDSLTLADEFAHDYISNKLQQLFPSIKIVSEEGEKVSIDSENFFLVDPLDGTKEFLSGNSEFTVNIGYIQNKKASLGAVSCPAKKEVFWTENNKSWFKRNNNIEVMSCFRRKRASNVFVSRSHLDDKTLKYLKRKKFEKISKMGSSLKICSIAKNYGDIYPRFGSTMEWDTAAAHAILKLAKGEILTFDNKELVYGKKNYKNEKFIAFGNIPEKILYFD